MNTSDTNIKKSSGKKKILIPVIVLAVIVIIFLAAGSGDKDKTDNTPSTTDVFEVSIPFETGTDPFAEDTIQSTPVRLSDSSLTAFKDYIVNFDSGFEYKDWYKTPDALKKLESAPSHICSSHTYDIRVNGKLDGDALYSIVIKNNKEFLKEHKHFYKEYSDADLKKLCNALVKGIEDVYNTFPGLDMDRLCCALQDLKILLPTNALDSAAVRENMLYYYNKDEIDRVAPLYKTDDPYTSVFYHEIMHFFQCPCPDITNNGEVFRRGVCIKFEDLDMNPLQFLWTLEAAAEQKTAEYLNIEPATYRAMIGYAKTLTLTCILNEDFQVGQVETLNFGHDINKLFEMFNISSQEDKIELINALYTIEIIQRFPNDFSEKYAKEKLGSEYATLTEDEKTQLIISIKDEALLSFAKFYYRSLAEQLNRGNITLEDVYYLLRVYETDILYHANVSLEGYLVFYRDFYDRYLLLQDEFFKYLAQDNGTAADELKDGFLNYSMNIKQGDIKKSPNCDLQFLPQEKKDWIASHMDDIYFTGCPGIAECPALADKYDTKNSK